MKPSISFLLLTGMCASWAMPRRTLPFTLHIEQSTDDAYRGRALYACYGGALKYGLCLTAAEPAGNEPRPSLFYFTKMPNTARVDGCDLGYVTTDLVYDDGTAPYWSPRRQQFIANGQDVDRHNAKIDNDDDNHRRTGKTARVAPLLLALQPHGDDTYGAQFDPAPFFSMVAFSKTGALLGTKGPLILRAGSPSTARKRAYDVDQRWHMCNVTVGLAHFVSLAWVKPGSPGHPSCSFVTVMRHFVEN
ncbi:hypothetical protein SPI_09064 [Niveomyces insectorum RCEF 264]|uniref:Uncharacterized protein n=1 Tax=Niveomyces insectorum RCEF 264 TaxID=1081102 RepID=A0A162MCB1_9HYPO|nr:hypothetical protein SPI_09064 [Niveomyces insectorum RCEF 264]